MNIEQIGTKEMFHAGYSKQQIIEGIEYAEEMGYDSEEERLDMIIGRILYTDEQLKDLFYAKYWDKEDELINNTNEE